MTSYQRNGSYQHAYPNGIYVVATASKQGAKELVSAKHTCQPSQNFQSQKLTFHPAVLEAFKTVPEIIHMASAYTKYKLVADLRGANAPPFGG